MSRHLVWGEFTCSETRFFNFSTFKSSFLENNHIRARKKAKWNKKKLESFKKKICSNPSIYMYHWNIYVSLFIRMQHNEKLNDYLPHSIYKRVSTGTQFAANCRQNCQLRWQILGSKKHYPARQYHIGCPCEYPNSQDDGYHLCQGYFNLDM